MTKKQSTAKGGTKGKAEGGKARARALAIVKDRLHYDYDTRNAIKEALADKTVNARGLATMIAEAEACEYVEHPLFDSFEPDFRANAHRVVRLLESGLPDWLLEAACDAINEAADAFNLPVMAGDGEESEYSARMLGTLFRVSDAFPLSDLPSHTLAGHIAAVMSHPDTPSELYNAMGEVITQMSEPAAVNHHPDVLRLVLKVYAKEKGGERDD